MYHQPEDHVILDRVIEIATKKGVKPAQVALAWLLQQNAVTSPIIGASKMYQLEEAIAAIQIKLEPEEVKHISEKYKVHPVLGRLS